MPSKLPYENEANKLEIYVVQYIYYNQYGWTKEQFDDYCKRRSLLSPPWKPGRGRDERAGSDDSTA